MHSPQNVRVSRTTPVCAPILILLLACGAGLGILAPRIAASEEAPPPAIYVVQAGDSLSSIASDLGTTVEELARVNALEDVNHLVTGTRLSVPAPPQPVRVAIGRTYRVQPGDTLWEIAESSGITPSLLAGINGLADEDQIYADMELRLPALATERGPAPRREHRVMAGETISSIAEDYGVSIAAIEEANALTNVNLIRPGQTLVVPAASLPELSAQTAAVLRETSSEFGIDRYLLLALSLMESGWQSYVVSHAGAVGLMQVMPDTAKWTVDYLVPAATNWRLSIRDNARVGAAYLDHLLFLEGGDVEGALASYYQGWASYKVDGMFEETRTYVDGILALFERLRSKG